MALLDSKATVAAPLFTVAALALLSYRPAFSQLTVLEVGPSGTYPTIQGAINAVVNGADTEIRVEGGLTYYENLEVPGSFNSGSLKVLGGWDSSFTSRDLDPEQTVIDGSASQQVLQIFIEGGFYLLDGFTITNGAYGGAGLLILPENDAVLVIRNVRIIANHNLGYPTARGGGVLAEPRGAQRLEIVDCVIQGNTAASINDGNAFGGGIFIESRDDSTFLIQDCEIGENSVAGEGGSRHGGGVHLQTSDRSSGQVINSVVFGNTILGTGSSKGSGGLLIGNSSSSLEIERTGWAMNEVSGGDSTAQLVTTIRGTLRLADSGVAQGDDGGLDVLASSGSEVHLVNLTVADHPGTGLVANQEGSSALTIHNTIAFGNGSDLVTSGAVTTGTNLIGIDPLFVDPLNLDYSLSTGSPAENMGDNDPAGGLAPLDINGNSRVIDGIVDIGAFEGIEVIFASSFETADTSTWSDEK